MFHNLSLTNSLQSYKLTEMPQFHYVLRVAKSEKGSNVCLKRRTLPALTLLIQRPVGHYVIPVWMGRLAGEAVKKKLFAKCRL
jgi:hypothetical protein